MSKKEFILKEIDDTQESFKGISKYIWENPEIGYAEYKASNILMETLEKAGFEMEKGILGLDTAFIATKKGLDGGPTVAIMSEYDALTGLGHACGHNLFSVSAVSAGVALSKVIEDIPGTIKVIGTPSEEGLVPDSGSKAIMAENGIFDNIDAAMICHAEGRTIVRRILVASCTLEITYIGKSAHAGGSPHEGINALEAGVLAINNINGIKQQFLPKVNVNTIITEGGVTENTIPERCTLRISVRAEKRDTLYDVIKKIENCTRASATATGCEIDFKIDRKVYDDLVPSDALSQSFQNALDELDVPYIEKEEASYGWDAGNVSYVCPTIGPYIKIGPDNLVGHTEEFAKASNSAEGYNGMITAAKAMALTTLDFLTNEKLREDVKEEFQKTKVDCN